MEDYPGSGMIGCIPPFYLDPAIYRKTLVMLLLRQTPFLCGEISWLVAKFVVFHGIFDTRESYRA